MKEKIHPKYYPNATVICGCGNTWHTGSTQEVIRTDVCSKCHPFFTGQAQRLIDTAGQVERFSNRIERAKALQQVEEERKQARAQRRRQRALVEIVEEAEEVEPIEGLTEEKGEEQA